MKGNNCMTKKKAKSAVIKFLSRYNEDIKTKLENVSAKVGKHNIPDELYPKRTSKKNRVMISWKKVVENDLSLEQLETFYSGVVVEFVNEDFLKEENQLNPLFIELKSRLGGNDTVSSIISFRSETGDSSSAYERHQFVSFANGTPVDYNGERVIVTLDNYKDFAIKRLPVDQLGPKNKYGIGNEKWTGFLFVSIQGGQHMGHVTHHTEEKLFNPACEYANEDVCIDISLVLAYFALHSINVYELTEDETHEYNSIKAEVENHLRESVYASENLFDYCCNHPCLTINPGKLTDPIQYQPIKIGDFSIKSSQENSIDFSHNEAVNKGKFYWDESKRCILSATRPTNIFWSTHLSNMMQQNFTLDEYFENLARILERRNVANQDNREGN